jgi:hypothetical protein
MTPRPEGHFSFFQANEWQHTQNRLSALQRCIKLLTELLRCRAPCSELANYDPLSYCKYVPVISLFLYSSNKFVNILIHCGNVFSPQYRNFISYDSGNDILVYSARGTMLQAGGSRVRIQWGHWIFNWPNSSSRTTDLRSTQPIIEMSTRNLTGGKGRPAHKADNLTSIREPTTQIMWDPQRLIALWASMACYRDSFTFHL